MNVFEPCTSGCCVAGGGDCSAASHRLLWRFTAIARHGCRSPALWACESVMEAALRSAYPTVAYSDEPMRWGSRPTCFA